MSKNNHPRHSIVNPNVFLFFCLFPGGFLAPLCAESVGKVQGNSVVSSTSTITKEAERKANGLITSNWTNFFNVTRLQFRVTPQGRQTYVHAMFVRFPYKLFLAEGLEYTPPFRSDPEILFLETYGGGPVVVSKANPKLFGWVTRLQSGTEMAPQYSAGAQYNLSDQDFFKGFFPSHKVTTFVQVFPVKNDSVLGNFDVLHYFSFSIYKKFYVRGFNRWFEYYGKKDYLLFIEDFILPVNPKFDLYARQTYQNRNDIQYGRKGSEWSFGMRLNLSL